MPPADLIPESVLNYKELKDGAHQLAKDDLQTYAEIAEGLSGLT